MSTFMVQATAVDVQEHRDRPPTIRTRQLPSFILPEVLGLRDITTAERVAREILNPFDTHVVHVSVAEVDDA
jgi:hypothetical protein